MNFFMTVFEKLAQSEKRIAELDEENNRAYTEQQRSRQKDTRHCT